LKKYKTIVVDPPWKYGKWGKASIAPRGSSYAPQDSEVPYQMMTLQEIMKLPIVELADDNCDLYLWTTQKYLPAAFDVIKAWGFKYCQTLTWCKKPKGTGQGGLYCPTTEFLLVCRRGKMPVGKKRLDTTWWEVKRPMLHSEKPELFHKVIEGQSDEPRLEMFARRKIDGWDVWGNEVDSDILLAV
jgi:N6-adenosine-specific RNA methylase IME4